MLVTILLQVSPLFDVMSNAGVARNGKAIPPRREYDEYDVMIMMMP